MQEADSTESTQEGRLDQPTAPEGVELAPVQPGLEGVVLTETRLSHVDGEGGELWIGGFAVDDWAPAASFEETIGLLWDGEPPSSERSGELRTALASHRTLSPTVIDLLDRAGAAKAPLMNVLRMASAALDIEDSQGSASGSSEEIDRDQLRASALQITAAFPVIVAHAWRRSQGLEPIEPRSDLGHAASFLHLLEGKAPSEPRVRALETYLNTVVDHGMNASTFTARVILSTRSDLVSAITGAVGALKGPLHGGAPGPALDMVFEIGDPSRAEEYLRDKIGRGERLMGFGHRVYKVRDPRADVLALAARKLADDGENRDLYRLATEVEKVALRVLEELKPRRRLQTNVEYYTALVLHAIGLSQELFTPTFAIGRVVGWCAHCFEQQETGRLIRPGSRYTGPKRARQSSARQEHGIAG